MFQTLKAPNGALGNSEYVIQSSIPAFGKVQATRKQPACTRCKMKKLKCIIESDDCEKCLESGVACSYRGTRRPSTRGSASGSASGTSSVQSEPTTTAYSKEATPCNQHPQSRSGVSRGSPGTNSVHVGGDRVHVGEMDTCMTPSRQQGSQGQGRPCSVPLDTDTAMATTPSFIADPSTEPSSFTQEMQADCLAGLDDATLYTDVLHDFDICFCTDRIIAANATMQVKLVWTTWLDGSSTSSIEDILQCQKNVLASCDTFLKCKRCSLKPDYVVLVISMCRETVDGVKALDHITSPEVLRSRRPHLDSWAASGKPRLEAGGWQLDDDDEIEIIRHLLQVRITKLRKLIGQLEHAVNDRHATYGWMVGNLRKSLVEKFSSVIPRAEDVVDLV